MDPFRLAVKAFIVNQKRQLLIIKRRPNDVHKPGVWDLPGGRLELGENPFDGLKRETKEEINLGIEILNPLQIHHFTRDDGQKITMIVFLCKSSISKVRLSEEHTDYKWVSIDDAKSLLVPNFHREVDYYKKYFKS